MTTSERIRAVRKFLGLSQEAFARQLGVSRDVIGNIEYDRLKRPDQKEPLYKLICSQFSIDEHWLQTGEGEMIRKADPSDLIMGFASIVAEEDSFRTRLLETLAQMTPEEWRLLERIAHRVTLETEIVL